MKLHGNEEMGPRTEYSQMDRGGCRGVFEGKVALVTGAANGIGKNTALALGNAGAKVVAADVRADGAEATAREIAAAGREAVGIAVDVADRRRVQSMVDRTIATFGQIDILVNCAGICQVVPFLDLREDQWDIMMDVNLKGTFLVSQAVLREMIKRREGKIVNIASLAGEVGGVVVGAHYAASKAGVISLIKSLAKVAAPYGITANAVSPGPVETDMIRDWTPEAKSKFKADTPLGRFATPEDITGAIMFLVSDAASYITGQVLRVNGGGLIA